MRRLVVVMALAVFALSGAVTANAADPVNAATTIDRSTITLGDRITLSVIVNAEPGYLPDDPTIAHDLGYFEVVQTQQSQKVTRGSQIQFVYKYSITAWRLGDLVIPSISISWIGPNGETGTARSKPP